MTNSHIYADLGEKMVKFARSIVFASIGILISMCIFSGSSTFLILSLMGGFVNVFVKYLNFLRSLQNIAFVTKDPFLMESQKRHYSSIIISIFSALLLYMVGADLIYKSTMGIELIFILIYLWHMILMVCQNLANQPLSNWFKMTFDEKTLSSSIESLHYGTIIQAIIVFPLITISAFHELGAFLKNFIIKPHKHRVNQMDPQKMTVDDFIESKNKESIDIKTDYTQYLTELELVGSMQNQIGSLPRLQLHRINQSPPHKTNAKNSELCSECGLNLPVEAIYCPNCGKSIENLQKFVAINN